MFITFVFCHVDAVLVVKYCLHDEPANLAPNEHICRQYILQKVMLTHTGCTVVCPSPRSGAT